MFEKLIKTPSRKSSAPKLELTCTSEFVACLREHGCRISYGALAQSARIFGEDASTQILAQRGAALVKSLPTSLQPYVCRKSGGYGKGVLSRFEQDLPSDLVDRPVITADVVAKAIEEFEAAR